MCWGYAPWANDQRWQQQIAGAGFQAPLTAQCRAELRVRTARVRGIQPRALPHSRCSCPPPAAHIPLFLYPFLNTISKTRPFEYLRLTSLGVIGALVKVRPAHGGAGAPDPADLLWVGCCLHTSMPFPLPARHADRLPPATCSATSCQVDDTEVINFLLSTEIIPLCLRTMETGSELSKTVATFIVQKILLDNVR